MRKNHSLIERPPGWSPHTTGPALSRTFLALALPFPPLPPSASDRSDSEASSSQPLPLRGRCRRCEGPVGEGRFLLPVLAVLCTSVCGMLSVSQAAKSPFQSPTPPRPRALHYAPPPAPPPSSSSSSLTWPTLTLYPGGGLVTEVPRLLPRLLRTPVDTLPLSFSRFTRACAGGDGGGSGSSSCSRRQAASGRACFGGCHRFYAFV